ncbi:MAG: AAA family ATPase [Oscillospiraceae bacterium]|nr:AAA family ATPase [Oscillospiraceae bacterium]
MDKHVKAIIDNYDSRLDGSSERHCVCVHGEHSTGKTAILEQLSDALLKKGVSVFFAIGKENDEALRELLRQLVRLYGEKYDKEFIDFISNYINATLSNNDYAEEYDKDTLVKFIYDCVKSEPTVFIVDDLDKADAFTINLLSNLLVIEAEFFLVVSISDNVDSIILSDMLYRNADNIMYVKQTSSLSSKMPAADEADILIDEALLVLNKPGREKQLIRHYLENAELYMKQLSYERAIKSFNDALTVSKNINDKDTQLSVLIRIGDARTKCKEFTDAADNYLNALQIATLQDFPDERALVLTKLVDCYDLMNKHDIAHEYIMMTEAFFAQSSKRTELYDVYVKHITKYLYLLTELSEQVIFSAKLKQAFNACKPDDNMFICSLFCEEGYMHMHTGEFGKAHEKLTKARSIASELKLNKMWNDTTNSLAICNESMGRHDASLELWNELTEKSHDPVKVAGAMVNAAFLIYEQDNDIEKALSAIVRGIELCILAGENQIAFDIAENLKDTPLAQQAATRLSKYRLRKSI